MKNFGVATGQSNVADRVEDCSTGQSAVVQYEYKNQTLEAFVAASCLSAKFDCPVVGPPELFTFSYCA